MINNFSGKYEFLSNFFMTPVLYEGILFPSSEHAYQAAKTTSTAERLIIFHCKTAGQAKRAGSKKSKKITLRPDWDSIRFEIMSDILEHKFQNNELAEKLIETRGQELVEGNYWHDNYWGICNCEKCESKPKTNNLGFILMRTRSHILSERDLL